MKWHLVVLKCISLKIRDFEHLFMCLSAICLSGEYSSPSPVLRAAWLFLLLLSCGSLGISGHNPYQICDLQTFSPVLWLAFSLCKWCPLTTTHWIIIDLFIPPLVSMWCARSYSSGCKETGNQTPGHWSREAERFQNETPGLSYLSGDIFNLCLPRWWLVVKNPPASAGDVRDVGSIPGLGRSPGDLRYSCLENLMDRGAW